MAEYPDFIEISEVGQNAVERQFRPELVVRFAVLRHHKYKAGMDVHEFLDQGITEICTNERFDWDKESKIFNRTMSLLKESMGTSAFKKNNRFSLAFYEFISLGLSKAIERAPQDVNSDFVDKRIKAIPSLQEAEQYTGIGIRGTTRLARFVTPLAVSHFSSQ